ncbi:MAG TPA: sigma factor, partial [Thermoanaerobaculia bacterium]
MDREEIESELERLHAASYAWALGRCGRDREEAEDVLQESYVKLLDGRARFAGGSSFKTFLFGVIRRTAAERRRRTWVRRNLLAAWGRSTLPLAEAPAGVDDGPAELWGA